MCPVAGGGGVCTVAGGFTFGLLDADIHCSLNQPRNADFSLYGQLFGNALYITFFRFRADIFRLDFAIAAVRRGKVAEHIKRPLAEVEPSLAQLHFVCRLGAADFVLVAAFAFQILVKSLVAFHFLSSRTFANQPSAVQTSPCGKKSVSKQRRVRVTLAFIPALSADCACFFAVKHYLPFSPIRHRRFLSRRGIFRFAPGKNPRPAHRSQARCGRMPRQNRP